MIKITGTIQLRGDYEIVLNMTEEEFDKLSSRQQEYEIADAVDWRNWLDISDVTDVDVWDIDEVKEEEEE